MIEQSFIESIAKLIDRDLKKLGDEISQYSNEESIWIVMGGIKNSAGNLCLHLCGNLQHFFGAVLGKTGYIRNRDNEFAAKGIPRAQLLTEIQNARQAVSKTLQSLDPELLANEYPEKVFDYPMTNMHFFMHLVAHLGYHLGQINYHRRLVE
ncbi:MAG TPA: DinB family protein [Cyclobacteriaceae bacterium]|nr:DUF1572 domain-containing protein [Cyclobacteriaceae bacterium]HMV08947.1 DinB family protein [Cyclobacteriaceae bacterium]HMV90142.1 DinB family protein [Cyclobacteriaceae bacterium]HMX00298.1 DinB family protein [Cyclobacteriaceae bacterium]HMX49703.1 DinB family protein [Cyclobacteriaceae bacterium]